VKEVWAIQHVGYEDLGSFEPVLKSRGFTVRYLTSRNVNYNDMYAGDPDLLVVLGGPMSPYDTDNHPWIPAEVDFVRERIATEKPLLGICFGSQIIAMASGSKTYKGQQGKEIGWEKITVNDDGMQTPFRHLDGALTNMMHWHGDTFDMPDGAVRLASSEKYKDQAYIIGNHIIAMQCHPEVTESKLKLWYNGNKADLEELGKSVPQLEQNASEFGPQLQKQAALFLNEWLDEQGL
jgi:GMP synthase (glutamine-hydrolysing)